MMQVGYWDDYPEDVGTYIGADEKSKLIDGKVAMQVTSVRRELSPFKADDGSTRERFVVGVKVGDEDRKLSFDTGVDSRDRLLGDIQKYAAEQGGELPAIRLEKAGRAILVKIARDVAAGF